MLLYYLIVVIRFQICIFDILNTAKEAQESDTIAL